MSGDAGGWRHRLVIVAMAVSGFSGLGYQVVWAQQGASWLGHEMPAVMAVTAAFFGGIAVGSYLLVRWSAHIRHPLRAYAACECVIALWALLLQWAGIPVSEHLAKMIGAEPTSAWQWVVSFVGTGLLLAPATLAMGATLPLVVRGIDDDRGAGRTIATLYATNTLGAFIGVLATAFALIPQFGLRATTIICAACSLAAGAAVAGLGAVPGQAPGTTGPVRDGSVRHAPWQLAVTGLVGIGYEVLVVRVLSEVTENSVYTYAAMLAVYLVGTAGGAALYRRATRVSAPAWLTTALLCALSLSCLAGGAALWAAQALRAVLVPWLSGTVAGALAEEAILGFMVFALPTLCMGALFSHLCAERVREGGTFGSALAANTLGAAFAPLLIGVMALPWMGAKITGLLLASGYAAFALNGKKWWWGLLPLSLAVWLAWVLPPLAFIDVPVGGRVISYRAGSTASVSIVQDASGVAVLRINNRQQEGSSATVRVDGRQGWLPILLHPDPHTALFLGLGTGVTSAAAALDPDLAVRAVELLPEVIDASGYFREVLASQLTGPVQKVTADARRYVRATNERFDVIVADNFHPARSGSGMLYTVEHFAAVRARLNRAGVFCQWLPLHQLDIPTLRSIVRSFLEVYPRGAALLASNSLQTPVIGLVARSDDEVFDLEAIRRRVRLQQAHLAGFGIEDDLSLFGTFIAGSAGLQAFVAGAPLNTDDHPVVVYMAPRITYAPDSTPAQRLLSLMEQVIAQPRDILGSGADPHWILRLTNYWRARDAFLRAGASVRADGDVRALFSQVGGPLLDVLSVSPDFRPAYDPLLRIAAALAQTDVAAARDLLDALIRAQPERPEGRALRASLPGT